MSRHATPFLLAIALFGGIQAFGQASPQGAQPMQSPSAQQPSPMSPPPSAQAPAAQPPAAATEPSPNDQAHEALQRLSNELNLTNDQKTKLEPIVAAEIQKVRDLRADTTLTPDQKQQQFQQMRVADHAKIQAILTPEQQQKLADINQKKAQERQAPPPSQPQH